MKNDLFPVLNLTLSEWVFLGESSVHLSFQDVDSTVPHQSNFYDLAAARHIFHFSLSPRYHKNLVKNSFLTYFYGHVTIIYSKVLHTSALLFQLIVVVEWRLNHASLYCSLRSLDFNCYFTYCHLFQLSQSYLQSRNVFIDATHPIVPSVSALSHVF